VNPKLYAVYKIVRVDGDAYGSISFSEGDAAYVRYEPGQWAHAPEVMRRLGYDLCVFPHLNYVRHFIDSFHGFAGSGLPRSWALWRCDAQDVHVPRVPHLDEWSAKTIPTIVRAVPIGAWPMGTLFARAVRLVERVPWDQLEETIR
jgi:hypothetical protein